MARLYWEVDFFDLSFPDEGQIWTMLSPNTDVSFHLWEGQNRLTFVAYLSHVRFRGPLYILPFLILW